MTVQIRPSSTLGRKWGRLITAAGPHLRAGFDGAALYTTWDIQNELDQYSLIGPTIYTALGDRGVVIWVGSTGRPLKDRICDHLRNPRRAAAFKRVAALTLRPDTAALEVGNLERHARFLLSPTMGTRWPRRH